MRTNRSTTTIATGIIGLLLCLSAISAASIEAYSLKNLKDGNDGVKKVSGDDLVWYNSYHDDSIYRTVSADLDYQEKCVVVERLSNLGARRSGPKDADWDISQGNWADSDGIGPICDVYSQYFRPARFDPKGDPPVVTTDGVTTTMIASYPRKPDFSASYIAFDPNSHDEVAYVVHKDIAVDQKNADGSDGSDKVEVPSFEILWPASVAGAEFQHDFEQAIWRKYEASKSVPNPYINTDREAPVWARPFEQVFAPADHPSSK